MLHRERFEEEYRRLYSEIGLGTTVWSPLASGLLTGKYNDGIPENSRLTLPGYEFLRDMLLGDNAEKNIAMIRSLGDVAKDLNTSMAKMALAWVLKNPNVSTVILGASRPEQLEENLGALDVVEKLTDDVMERIEKILSQE
jgi:aryl-alcohol dehydrogenase-like predicted oxidoreductase